MPRTRRRIVPDVVYHLISRFVDREWFIENELERLTYLDLLGAAIKRSTWRCLGFAVMSNHIHLAMVAGVEPLSNWIRTPHSAFADWMNRSRGRIGCMFVRGPKSILVPDARVGHLLAYIHNNPVRAGVVDEPSESTWTSHRFYAGPNRPIPRWLRVDEGLRRTTLRRGATFDKFVRSTTGHPVLGEVDSDQSLAQKLEAYEQQENALFEPPPSNPTMPMEILERVVAHFGLTVAQVKSKRRGRSEQQARAAIILCGARLGVPSRELAECLCLTPQGVSKILLRKDVPDDLERLVARVLDCLQPKLVA